MWSSMQVNMWAYDCQSKNTCEHEIYKACEHTSTWAFKPQSTLISTVQLPLDLTTIIKVGMCSSIQIHERFGLQAYRYILDQVCLLVIEK